MEHNSSSVLGKSTLMLVIVAIIAIAPKFALANLAPFCLFPLCPLVTFCFPSFSVNPNAAHGASRTLFQIAPARNIHTGTLEGKGYSPRQSAFQIMQAVAQVAG